MKKKLEGDRLTICLNGRVDSTNAVDFEKELLEAVAGSPDVEISLDVEELMYISSAGLRGLMKLRKQTGRTLTIVNVSPEVYEIFDTTGFTDLFDVKKRLRSISVEGCEKIGRGANGEIYRLDPETIVKVYTGVRNSPEKIAHNRELSKKVFTHGIPSVIPFDMVKVGDDYGLVYEMLSGGSLANHLSKHPEEIELYGKKLAELLHMLHETTFEKGELQDARKPYLDDIELLRKTGWYTDTEADRLITLVEGIPERNTFIHQDFHPGNIMLMDGELVLIDVDDSGIGHPMLDLMGMYQVYVAAAKTGWTKMMMGLGEEEFRPLWNTALQEYLGKEQVDDIPEINRVLQGYTRMKHIRGVATSPQVPEELRKPAVEREKAELFDVIDTLYPVPKWF